MAAVDQHLTSSANTYSDSSNQWSSNVSGGVKRKHSVVEEEDANKWTERQSILNLSMTKLQPSQTKSKVEASLRRSVLIFNTLRYLESQIQHDCPQAANIAIPARDICLEPPCHADEVLHISKEDERLKQEKLEDKQEVKAEALVFGSSLLPQQVTSQTTDHFQTTSSTDDFSNSQPVFGSLNLLLPQEQVTSQTADPFQPTSSSSLFSSSTTSSSLSTTAPVVQYSAASQYQQPQYQPPQYQQPQYPATGQYQNSSSSPSSSSSDQLFTDTSCLLDSLLSGGSASAGEKVSVPSFQSSFCPALAVERAPSWEETDNIVWNSKYDEPFTHWLLNDDLDHIMQMLVSGSAS